LLSCFSARSARPFQYVTLRARSTNSFERATSVRSALRPAPCGASPRPSRPWPGRRRRSPCSSIRCRRGCPWMGMFALLLSSLSQAQSVEELQRRLADKEAENPVECIGLGWPTVWELKNLRSGISSHSNPKAFSLHNLRQAAMPRTKATMPMRHRQNLRAERLRFEFVGGTGIAGLRKGHDERCHDSSVALRRDDVAFSLPSYFSGSSQISTPARRSEAKLEPAGTCAKAGHVHRASRFEQTGSGHRTPAHRVVPAGSGPVGQVWR
jgi:hypothetical protein